MRPLTSLRSSSSQPGLRTLQHRASAAPLALAAFFSSAQAVEQSVNYDADFRFTKTAKTIADGSVDRTSSADKIGTLTYRASNLPHHASVQGALTTEFPDYSQEKLVQADGSNVLLGEAYPKGHVRFIGAANASVGFGAASTVSASLSGTLNETPYKFVGGGLALSHSLYAQTTFLNAAVNLARDNSPASVFITPGVFFPTRNPTTVDATEFTAGAEQILGERWKASLDLNTGRKLQSRPRYFGAKAKVAVALAGKTFLQGNFQYARDRRSDALKSELGYMAKTQGEALLTIEPIYDLLLSASYGLVQESVDDPRSGKILRARAHQIGTGASWDFGDFEPQARAAYVLAASDKQTNQFQFGGGLTWSF